MATQTDTKKTRQTYFYDDPQWKAFQECYSSDTKKLPKVMYILLLAQAAGYDPIAGLVLSQIVYWHMPGKQNGPKGPTRLEVEKRPGELWLAKNEHEWFAETCLSKPQIKRALTVLEEIGIIETRKFRFAGAHTNHIRILPEGLQDAIARVQETPMLSKPPTVGGRIGQQKRDTNRAQKRAASTSDSVISQGSAPGDKRIPPGDAHTESHESSRSKVMNHDFPNASIMTFQNDETALSLTETTAEPTNKDYFHILLPPPNLAPQGADFSAFAERDFEDDFQSSDSERESSTSGLEQDVLTWMDSDAPPLFDNAPEPDDESRDRSASSTRVITRGAPVTLSHAVNPPKTPTPSLREIDDALDRDYAALRQAEERAEEGGFDIVNRPTFGVERCRTQLLKTQTRRKAFYPNAVPYSLPVELQLVPLESQAEWLRGMVERAEASALEQGFDPDADYTNKPKRLVIAHVIEFRDKLAKVEAKLARVQANGVPATS